MTAYRGAAAPSDVESGSSMSNIDDWANGGGLWEPCLFSFSSSSDLIPAGMNFGIPSFEDIATGTLLRRAVDAVCIIISSSSSHVLSY